MGMRVGGQDSFVVVSYDFEYTSEEGKRVWMKEGEVLLLLAKTNNDWWQVIRRDRRPFYAPARYVAELSNDSGEWDSAFSGEGVHYRPDNGEPIGFQEKKNNFSTFLGGGNKRSSYASPQTHHHGPPSSDFLFGAPRFQERYRSNSMDSILVADMNRQLYKPPKQQSPFVVMQQQQQQQQLPPAAVMGIHQHHLEKRPTFDNIDKRSSWSQDKSRQLGGVGSFAQPNTVGSAIMGGIGSGPTPPPPTLPPALLHAVAPVTAAHASAMLGLPLMPPPAAVGGHPMISNPTPTAASTVKKPVPLPRSSKIPLPAAIGVPVTNGHFINNDRKSSKAATIERLAVQQQQLQRQQQQTPTTADMRAFKRSKTDLSLGMLNQYKASRAGGNASTGLVPRESITSQGRIVFQQQQQQARAGHSQGHHPHHPQGRSPGSQARMRLSQQQQLHGSSFMPAASNGSSSSSFRPGSALSQQISAATRARSQSNTNLSSSGHGQVNGSKHGSVSSNSSNGKSASGGSSHRPSSAAASSHASVHHHHGAGGRRSSAASRASMAASVIREEKALPTANSDHKTDPPRRHSNNNTNLQISEKSDTQQARKPAVSIPPAKKTSGSSSVSSGTTNKPAIKEKPCVPLIKSSLNSATDKKSGDKQLKQQRGAPIKASQSDEVVKSGGVGNSISKSQNQLWSTNSKDSAVQAGRTTSTEESHHHQTMDDAANKANNRQSPPADRDSDSASISADQEDELKISLKVEAYDSSEAGTTGSETGADPRTVNPAAVTPTETESVPTRRTSRDASGLSGSAGRGGSGSREHLNHQKDSGECASDSKTTTTNGHTDLDHEEGKENLNPQTTTTTPPTSITTTTTTSTSEQKFSKKFTSKRGETNEKFLDETSAMPLPEPPPTPPFSASPPIRPRTMTSTASSSPPVLSSFTGGGARVAQVHLEVEKSAKTKSQPISIPVESQPLVISTEPMSTSSSSVLHKSEDKSNCSSSFDSLDGSLDSTGWQEGGERSHNGGMLVSPNHSTCSRAPPASPLPGSTPLRRCVFADWDEFVDDASGRKFYYNGRTREKSWKPPRAARMRGTSSEGYSAPTSPDPYLEINSGDSGRSSITLVMTSRQCLRLNG